MKMTTRILYLIYLGLTIIEVILLLFSPKQVASDGTVYQMDLFNNALGRTIGSRSYSGNSSQVSYAIRQAVLKAVKNGEARRFVGSDIGTKNTLQKTNSNGIK